MSAWTREEAAVQLHLCSAEKHWITTPTCDSCWVNEHRCPPSPEELAGLVDEVDDPQRRVRPLRERLDAAGRRLPPPPARPVIPDIRRRGKP